MKKLLTVVLLALLLLGFNSVQAQNDDVDIRLDLVSNTFNVPSAGQGTMIINLDLKSTLGNCTVTTLQNDVQMSAALNTAYLSHTFAPTTPSSGSHTSDRITFNFIGQSFTANTSGWTTCTTLTIVYNMGAGLGTVDWYTGGGQIALNIAGTSDAGSGIAQEGVEIPLNDPTDSENPPEDLPLPVQLAAFSAVKVQDGVKLNWKTQSEIEVAGFRVLRSEAVDGQYSAITDVIAAKGSSTSPAVYNYTDQNIETGKTYYYKLQETTTYGNTIVIGSTQVEIAALPASLVLYQNYPNPFNPSTEIRFDLPQEQHVELVIYNLLGKQVRTLINGVVSAGEQHVTWDGLNNNGLELSSGIYFYKLSADGFTRTYKMTKLE